MLGVPVKSDAVGQQTSRGQGSAGKPPLMQDLQSRTFRRRGEQQGEGTGADVQSLIDLIQNDLPGEWQQVGSLPQPDEWQQRGGLSLPIDLPTDGQALTFNKVGGAPKLTLRIRPRETGETSARWLWAIIVFLAGAWLLHQIANRAALANCRRGVSFLFVAVGLIALLCLPLPLSLLGGLLLITGSLLGLLAWQPASPS